MVTIGCRDLGASCDFKASADTVDGLIPLLEDHARKIHGFESLPPEMTSKIRSLAKEVETSRKS